MHYVSYVSAHIENVIAILTSAKPWVLLGKKDCIFQLFCSIIEGG
jgi:hypothetical protein